MSYSRSYCELIKIKLEIIWESCVDFFLDYYPTFRKALICLAAGAIALSIRTSQKGVSSYNTSYKNGFLPSLLGKKTSSKINNPSLQYGPQHGASHAQLVASQRSSNQLSRYSPPQRSTGSNIGLMTTGNNQAALGVQTAVSGYSTSQLVDQYGLGTLQVAQGGYFKDYGGASTFSGQIQTLNAVESPSLVERILQTPVQGQILVVDGGGSLNGAVFDSSMATTAVRNGWKGIIINGVIRNVHSLSSLQFGIKAIGTHPTKGTQNVIGQPGLGLSFAGVNFSPGHWIYADKDGIVISQTSLGIVMGGATKSGNVGNVMQNGMQQYGTGQLNQQAGQLNQQNVMSSNSQFQNGLSSNRGTTSQYQQGTTSNIFPSQTGYQGSSISKNGISSTSTMTATAGGIRSSYGKPAGSYNSLYNKPGGQYGSGSYGYGRKKSTFTKKKLIGLLLLIIAIVWCCLGDF